MSGWMVLWAALLCGGSLGLLGLLIGVTTGAVRELKQSLAELSPEEARSRETREAD